MTLPSPPLRRRRHLPPPTPHRDSRSRLSHMVRSHEERERPFDPERAPTWRGSARDLVVNPVPATFRGPVELFMYDDVERSWGSVGRLPNVRAAEQRIRDDERAGIVDAKYRIERIGNAPDSNLDIEYRLNPGGFREDLRELVERYHGQLDTDLSVDEMTAEIADAFEKKSTERALREASDILEGHGVEELGGVDMRDGPRYLYINFGDTYDPTIMWSRDDNKVFVSMGGWGQFMEDEGEPDMFDDAWNDWLASDFNNKLENEAISRDERDEDDPEGLQAKAMEFIDSEEGTKELFQRALQRAANGAPMGKTPELVWESDGSLFVPHLNLVVHEAVSMIEEGWKPGEFEGHARNWHRANPDLSPDEFRALLESLLELQGRYVRFNIGDLGTSRTLYVNFINLPAGVGSAGGGAEAQNNRMMFQVMWPRGRGPYADDKAIAEGQVRVEQSVSALPREYRLRAKSGRPEVIARYLADFINRVVREVPPKYTHTR